MAALQTEGCQGTDKEKEPPKGHSRNGSIEKYFFKKKPDSLENDVKENGSDNVSDKVSEKTDSCIHVNLETPSVNSSDIATCNDKETNVENNNSSVNEIKDAITNSIEYDCDKENTLEAKIDTDLDKEDVKASKNDSTKEHSTKQTDLMKEVENSPCSGIFSEKVEDSKMADLTENAESSNLVDNSSAQTVDGSEKLVGSENDLSNNSLLKNEETVPKERLPEHSQVFDPVKDVHKNSTVTPKISSVDNVKFEMNRPKGIKLKQKARKSSKPIRDTFSSSCIKTVNLAPIANVRVKLPVIESALNLCPKLESSKMTTVKKSFIQVMNPVPPKLEPIPTSLPPSQESAGEPKLLPGKRVAMNARTRRKYRKRHRRWGKGDLPLPAKNKKPKPPVNISTDHGLSQPISGHSLDSNEANVINEIKPAEFTNPSKKLQQNLGIRHKASPTIVQLLTKHRPKLSNKSMSLLRAKKMKVSGSDRTGKTVAELLLESRRQSKENNLNGPSAYEVGPKLSNKSLSLLHAKKLKVSGLARTGKTVAELLLESRQRHVAKENSLKGPSALEARLSKPTFKREGVSLLSSPGIGCGRRVSLRKRKPTEEENGNDSADGDSYHGNTSTVMTTPSSGSKKRKMCAPGRVLSGGEKWQKGEEFDIPEADQGTRETPDLPPSTISSITTVTRADLDRSSPSVNVAISLDPAVITVATIATDCTKNNSEVEKKLQNEQSGQSSKMSNSTLRSVLLDPSIYSHPLLGRKHSISLLSGKALHGSNGAIYPVTPSKLEVATGGNYPRPASAPGVGSSSPPQRDVLPLCCCKITGACVSRPPKPVLYCQALDSVDGKVMGCCNKVSTPQLVRPAVKIPFMAVCEVHRKRLRLHQCCPGCGHFCTQGLFYQCRKEGGSSTHHFHKGCQVFKNGKYYCPHCGEESLQYEVNLRLNEPRHMTKFGRAEQEFRLSLSRAKMAVTANALKSQESELSENVATATYIVEGSNKEFSTAGLPFGPDRYSLERILYLMPQDRPKKYRVLPKYIHGPAKEADLDKVVYMLVDGYDPNEKFEEFDGQTGLHAAGIGGCLPVLHVLIQAGADVNCIDSLLKTPLMYASENNHLPVLKYLIRAGASVHSRGEDGMTCFHLAAKAGHIEIMRYLLQHSDIDINIQDDGGWTPIIWAAEHRHASSVKFLLAQGANPNLKDQEENTGLHWAAFSGSVDIAEIFLNAGCDIESPNEHGDRPLHIAARQDHYECVVLILARGGDVEAKNNENEPPIGCCLDQTSQVWMALRVNRQLKGFAAKRLGKTERLIHRDITLGKENNPIPGVNCVDEADHPTDYLYVTENCETSPLNINRTITSLQSCGCKDNCTSISCNCSRNSVKCWFDKDGRLLPEFNTLEPPLIFECNRACRCWTTCNNRVVQNGITCRLQLFRTCGRGWGVKALLDIPPGSFICEYIGELISDSEADRREDDSYLFDLDNKDGETYCIDARKYGNVARFINHLCEPNIIPVKVFVEHQDLRFPRICFYSSRPIKAQEELGFDYGEKFWMIKWKQFTCACGSPKCKYSSETIHKTLEEYKLRHEDDDTARELV